jgi:hypothetical protein
MEASRPTDRLPDIILEYYEGRLLFIFIILDKLTQFYIFSCQKYDMFVPTLKFEQCCLI